ncbi:hypothetical protein Trydic_g17752 [Trypoxylus dichotomus]
MEYPDSSDKRFFRTSSEEKSKDDQFKRRSHASKPPRVAPPDLPAIEGSRFGGFGDLTKPSYNSMFFLFDIVFAKNRRNRNTKLRWATGGNTGPAKRDAQPMPAAGSPTRHTHTTAGVDGACLPQEDIRDTTVLRSPAKQKDLEDLIQASA